MYVIIATVIVISALIFTYALYRSIEESKVKDTTPYVYGRALRYMLSISFYRRLFRIIFGVLNDFKNGFEGK